MRSDQKIKIFFSPGFGENTEIREEVHADEGKHPGRLSEDPNSQVSECDGSGGVK